MEAVNKLCELCRTETPEDGRRICEKCLGTSTVLDVVPGTESCKQCGEVKPVEELKRARYGWCFECTTKDMRQAKLRKTQKKTSIGNSDTNLGKDDDHLLTIDFKRHGEVLQRILKLADDQLRSPENQVLYWLINSQELNSE